MKKVPTLEQFIYNDKLVDKLLRSKGVKRGKPFTVGDGYLCARKFILSMDGSISELAPSNMIGLNGEPIREAPTALLGEDYEYIYKAVILGRGHLWKEKPNKN